MAAKSSKSSTETSGGAKKSKEISAFSKVYLIIYNVGQVFGYVLVRYLLSKKIFNLATILFSLLLHKVWQYFKTSNLMQIKFPWTHLMVCAILVAFLTHRHPLITALQLV